MTSIRHVTTWLFRHWKPEPSALLVRCVTALSRKDLLIMELVKNREPGTLLRKASASGVVPRHSKNSLSDRDSERIGPRKKSSSP